ncbi:hypothetical protein XENOCAPTIV_026967 [Xenoophorus captivus]|uniref:Uncharacterized protein n=1 Tax=Xenoophorus captivus TaxID=1517983 RepID=A0ABV0Q6C2_9TELE
MFVSKFFNLLILYTIKRNWGGEQKINDMLPKVFAHPFKCSNHFYEIKHLGMQTVSTNICERMDGFQELSEFQRGTVIGCHLYNTFSHEIVAPKYSTINCQWYYKKVEAIGNDSNSTTNG